jgi:glycosyltransferase involved in cell wall biosynthesis
MSFITVIIPILNAMPYLPEALASLEAQTHRDFEVCLWDNGSTDGSVEEAIRWIPERLPGRVVTGNPLPLHQCLARMVEEAKTEFVARMDGDDICLPDRFQQQLEFLKSSPTIALVGGQIVCINERGVALTKDSWANYSLEHSDIVSRMMVQGPFNHPSILFRRAAIIEVGNYLVPAPVEDHNLYLKLVQKYKVANLSAICVKYRIHSKSICAGAQKDNLHNRLTLRHTATEAEHIYGIKKDVFQSLRSRRHLFSIAPLLKSALFRSRKENIRVQDILFSGDFILAARYMTSNKDFFSKTFWSLLEFGKKFKHSFPR